jgi:hypothetical protein
MASSGGAEFAAAVSGLAKTGSAQGEQTFDRALGAAIAAGTSVEDAVKAAREAAHEQERLAKVDVSTTGALTGAGPQGALQGKPEAVSKALGSLLARGVPLEHADQTLQQLDKVMDGYAKADAHNEAARMASPERLQASVPAEGNAPMAAALMRGEDPGTARQRAQRAAQELRRLATAEAGSGEAALARGESTALAGVQDPVLQKALAQRLMRGESGRQALAGVGELSRLLVEPAPTTLASLAKGGQAAEQLAAQGRSRVFNRVLSAALARGVAPEQALRTARQAEEDMALRVPVPGNAASLIKRNPKAEISVRTESGDPLPSWVRFDRASASFVLHDVPPDGPRIRVVLSVAGEQVRMELGEVTPMPDSPGPSSRGR